MPSLPKHNLFDAEGSDEDASDAGYDSAEAREESRVARAPKRKRVGVENDEEAGASSDEEELGVTVQRSEKISQTNKDISADSRFRVDDEFEEDNDDASEGTLNQEEEVEFQQQEPKKTQVGSRKIATSKQPASKSGVVYLSRVPPFMKPQTVKHLLTSFGEVGRIFLTPEDPVSHTRRVKSGGNKKKTFSDGWVEFVHKKDAKLAAETLNAQIIGGKKGGYYHDDIWNMKYLQGFKWHHLTEQIANENAERASRLRTEISQTTRENKRFIENVERAKVMETKEAKKRKRDEKGAGEGVVAAAAVSGAGRAFKTQFRQSEVRSKSSKATEQPAEVQRVLSKIF